MRHGQTQNEREARGERMVCRACETPFTPRKNGLKCRQCHVWACNAACGRAVADLHCCRMSGVASHVSQSQSWSQGLSSCAAEGAPRLRQGMEQAIDVQMADVQCDQQSPNEPRIPPQRSAGLKSSCWSWRHHCQPREPSGTSHGARGKGHVLYSRSCYNITRIAISNGSSGVILSPSRLRLLQPDGPDCFPRCLW